MFALLARRYQKVSKAGSSISSNLLYTLSSRSSTTTFATMATTTITPPRDPNTLSNYVSWRTTHSAVSFKILFDSKKLSGSVVHTLKSTTNAESKEIILDSSFVQVSSVTVDDQKVKWELLPRVEPYGSALKIELDKAIPKDQTVKVAIVVATTDNCTALQWMTPEQTSNKKHPYVFSQCQAIHARSVFPCQDTPDVKAPFDFHIESPLHVIASGIPSGQNPSAPSSDFKPQIYDFQQKVPIPSYLWALASGDIAVAPVGPRSFVATGPDELRECQWELEADTENYLQAGESLVYPYAWGQYDVLILPPSFPYGGMENPIYTFATPTIISGDRQNVDVIAHELSHSWSGNLVTNASWEHFWLNEGWTTYLERRIQAKVHGDFAWRDFSAIIGWKALTDSIKSFGEHHEFTKLIPDLKGKDPDDAFSSIPYEKGFTFLLFIENLIGISAFDKFIPHYFEKWRGKSLDSYDFKATLLDFFASDTESSKKLSTIDWDKWFYTPGFPPKPNFNTKFADAANALADKWEKLTHSSTTSTTDFAPSPSDIADLQANQIVVFLERVLLFKPALPTAHAHAMGDIYQLRSSKNVEVSSRYFQIAMQSNDSSVKPYVADLLGKVGRMKFVRPLFKGLLGIDRGLAVETFEKNRDFYHPICRAWMEKTLSG